MLLRVQTYLCEMINIGLRNRMVHDYGNTDYEIIWGIVYLHLDNLILEIEREIKKLLELNH